MKMDVTKAEKYLKATGQGAWSKIEVDRGRIITRLVDIKPYDGPSNVYFTRDREQVVSGNMYATLGIRNPFRLREMIPHMVYTHLELTKPIPKGYRGVLDPVPEMVEAGFHYMPTEIPEGTTGVVRVPVMTLRRMSIVEMAAVAYFSIESVSPQSNESGGTSKSKSSQKSTQKEPE